MATVIDAEVGAIELHRRACAATRRFIAGIKPDQWQDRCPAEGTVRGLVTHLVGGQRLTVELLHGKSEAEAGAGLAGDLLGDDPLAAYDTACAVADAAWQEPGALERTCRMEHGDQPAALWASIRAMDMFVHGWDLAIATGQNDRLDPDLVPLMYDEWRPREEFLRGSGMFGPPPAIAPDASLQTKLLALFGRSSPAARPIRAHELGHVGMYVRDLSASVRFYRDLVGFGESGRLPGAVFLTSGRSHHEMALIEPGPEAVAGPRQPAFGVNHVAVKVGDSLDELRNAYRRVVEAGVPVLEITDFTIQQSIQVHDPDGTVVELYVDSDVPWRDNPHILEQALPKPLQL